MTTDAATNRALAEAFTDVYREIVTAGPSSKDAERQTFRYHVIYLKTLVDARAVQYAAEDRRYEEAAKRTAEMVEEGRALAAKLGEGEG